jgi:hypothetical protein
MKLNLKLGLNTLELKYKFYFFIMPLLKRFYRYLLFIPKLIKKLYLKLKFALEKSTPHRSKAGIKACAYMHNPVKGWERRRNITLSAPI